MTKVFKNSNQSNIIGTNKINNVTVNKDNIIEADSEFREVVKKGYLLNQINLSTIPTIIQDALDKLIEDAKNTTLSDSLIQNLKQSLESLDDGIYKKTYIDNTITYLEDLLTSKVSLETVASITDNKIATATENLVTTSQAQLLTNRLGNSESEIAATKELINTKDSARANQITELLANINNAFAGYSEAIELYVDSQGNIKSEKIEKLELGNYLQKVSITEDNKIEIDERGNYTAISSKVIVNSAGEIVGFKITDTNDLSTFKINTDVFEIANSTNTFTPFRIEDNTLLFNGRVTFSNITGGESIVTTASVQNAINNNVTTIDGGIVVTNEALVNNLNATGGIIADTVTANEFVGKTFIGSVFNGARINGAVIKASYLDLDGELEVLTNYHITLAMYNANPSLYTDAVYIAADNEYRIPSISTVKENVRNGTSSSIFTIYGSIWSYNTANSGTNLKAVKVRPAFLNTSTFGILTSRCGDAGVGSTGTKNHIRIMLGSILLFDFKVVMIPNGSGNYWQTQSQFSGSYFTSFNNTYYTYSFENKHLIYNLNIGIGILEVAYDFSVGSWTDGDGTASMGPNTITISCNLLSGEQTFPSNWDNGRLSIQQIVAPNGYLNHNNTNYLSGLGYTTYNIKQSLQINNMI